MLFKAKKNVFYNSMNLFFLYHMFPCLRVYKLSVSVFEWVVSVFEWSLSVFEWSLSVFEWWVVSVFECVMSLF